MSSDTESRPCRCPGVDGYVIPLRSCPHHEAFWRRVDERAATPPAPEPERTWTEDEIERACAWADYRKDYGIDEKRMAVAHAAFKAGWAAARGTLDAGGVLR